MLKGLRYSRRPWRAFQVVVNDASTVAYPTLAIIGTTVAGRPAELPKFELGTVGPEPSA